MQNKGWARIYSAEGVRQVWLYPVMGIHECSYWQVWLSGKVRNTTTVLLSLGDLARNLGEISSVPVGNGFRVRVKLTGVDISDLGVKSKKAIKPLNMSDFIDMRPTYRHNPDSKYTYSRKLERIHQKNRVINTWNECSTDKSKTACKVIPNFEKF